VAKGESPRPTARLATVPVTGRARLAAWLARTRFGLQLAGVFVLLGSLTMTSGRLWYILVGVALLAVSVAVRSRRLHRPWSARRRSGVLTGQRTAPAAALAALSAAAAVATVLFAVCWLFALFMRSSVAVLPSGRLDISLLASGSPYRFLILEPVTVLVVDFFALAVMAAIVVPVSYTAARRVAALSAEEAVKRVALDGGSGPAPVLYLRNFTDDDIQMPTSRLSRNSLVERIAVYRLERFEEVIVRHLGEAGPVIAVNPPGLEKTPIGAARMNLANTDWRASVRQYIGSARLIVVGAAPEGSTEGLAWELSEIARAGALDRTLLVLPPLRSQTVQDPGGCSPRWPRTSACRRSWPSAPTGILSWSATRSRRTAPPAGAPGTRGGAPSGPTRWRCGTPRTRCSRGARTAISGSRPWARCAALPCRHPRRSGPRRPCRPGRRRAARPTPL
jgi:hypothetical protein